MSWSPPLQPCAHCYGPKPRGRGRKLCDRCAGKVQRGRCRQCGAPKQRNAQLCWRCRRQNRWAIKRRGTIRRRQPCVRCGRPKQPGRSRKYCDACRAVRAAAAAAPKLCCICGLNAVRYVGAKQCSACIAKVNERRRERFRYLHPNARRLRGPIYLQADFVDARPLAAFMRDAYPGADYVTLAHLLKLDANVARRVFEGESGRIALDIVDRALTTGLGRPDLVNVLYPVPEVMAA